MASIQFDTIPASIRKPGVYAEFNTRLAVRTLPANKQRLLIVAQRTAAGTAPAGVPAGVFSDEQAATLFGRGSMAHRMVKAALVANRYVEVTVLPLADAGAGVAAVSTVTVSGTAVTAGTATVSVGGQSVSVGVAATASAASIATALKAELDKLSDLPFSASVAGAVITLTALNKGTVANGITIAAATDASGITLAAAQTTAGSIDPDLTAALASVFTASHEIIVWPYANQAALTALRTHLRDRSSALEQRGGRGVCAATGTLSAATTLAGQVNDGRILLALLPASATPGHELAAALASIAAFEEDPARPLNGLELPGVLPPALAARLSRTEQEVALANGVTPLEVGPGERVQIVRAITTYTLNAAGIPDIALLEWTTIGTLDYVRRAVRERIAMRFPRDKMVAGIEARIRSEIFDVLLKCEDLGVLEQVQANKDGIVVQRSTQDPTRMDAAIPTDVVNGLHVFAARIDLLL